MTRSGDIKLLLHDFSCVCDSTLTTQAEKILMPPCLSETRRDFVTSVKNSFPFPFFLSPVFPCLSEGLPCYAAKGRPSGLRVRAEISVYCTHQGYSLFKNVRKCEQAEHPSWVKAKWKMISEVTNSIVARVPGRAKDYGHREIYEAYYSLLNSQLRTNYSPLS